MNIDVVCVLAIVLKIKETHFITLLTLILYNCKEKTENNMS